MDKPCIIVTDSLTKIETDLMVICVFITIKNKPGDFQQFYIQCAPNYYDQAQYLSIFNKLVNYKLDM